MAGVVSLNDTEGVSRTIATIEGLIRAREAAFKHYQIDISEFRERRFGAAGGGGTDPKTSSATSSWSSTTTATCTTRTLAWVIARSRSPARACPTVCT